MAQTSLKMWNCLTYKISSIYMYTWKLVPSWWRSEVVSSFSQFINKRKYGRGLKETFFSSASFWMILAITARICTQISRETLKQIPKTCSSRASSIQVNHWPYGEDCLYLVLNPQTAERIQIINSKYDLSRTDYMSKETKVCFPQYKLPLLSYYQNPFAVKST